MYKPESAESVFYARNVTANSRERTVACLRGLTRARHTRRMKKKKPWGKKRGEREWGDVIAPNRAHRENERERVTTERPTNRVTRGLTKVKRSDDRSWQRVNKGGGEVTS